jgi:hypothetical protein
MPNSAYFARRAEHYRQRAAGETIESIAEGQFLLANMFLQMSDDCRRMERTGSSPPLPRRRSALAVWTHVTRIIVLPRRWGSRGPRGQDRPGAVSSLT